MVNHKEYIDEVTHAQGPIQLGNQEVMNAEKFGIVNVISIGNGIEEKLMLKDVLYVPHLM